MDDDGPVLKLSSDDFLRTYQLTPQSDMTALELARLFAGLNVQFVMTDEKAAELGDVMRHLTLKD